MARVTGLEGFYIEYNCPFGCSSFSSNTGITASDDPLPFRVPSSSTADPVTGGIAYTYPYHREQVLSLIMPISTLLHPLKRARRSSPRLCHCLLILSNDWRDESGQPLSRSYLPTLSTFFVSSFDGESYKFRYPPLRSYRSQVVGRDAFRGPVVDCHLYVDASTYWRTGILLGGQWAPGMALARGGRAHVRSAGSKVVLELLSYVTH
ncbi:hypothetical protein B0H14DRAFT_3526774 [Mycena olivaceomarginata]|nr:hypothetical protein B0H14DRAFT_3526774 [Mycena olivaceomarginata]